MSATILSYPKGRVFGTGPSKWRCLAVAYIDERRVGRCFVDAPGMRHAKVRLRQALVRLERELRADGTA